jgi:hypothetical protein
LRSNRAVDNALQRAYKIRPKQANSDLAAAIPPLIETFFKACHRYSDCRSHFAGKFQGAHSRRLAKSKIANLKSKTANAPLAQLAEQVTLNHWVAGSIPARCISLLVERHFVEPTSFL